MIDQADKPIEDPTASATPEAELADRIRKWIDKGVLGLELVEDASCRFSVGERITPTIAEGGIPYAGYPPDATYEVIAYAKSTISGHEVMHCVLRFEGSKELELHFASNIDSQFKLLEP